MKNQSYENYIKRMEYVTNYMLHFKEFFFFDVRNKRWNQSLAVKVGKESSKAKCVIGFKAVKCNHFCILLFYSVAAVLLETSSQRL